MKRGRYHKKRKPGSYHKKRIIRSDYTDLNKWIAEHRSGIDAVSLKEHPSASPASLTDAKRRDYIYDNEHLFHIAWEDGVGL